MGIGILFRSVRKTFVAKKVQLAAVAVIIFLSSFIYAAMFLTTSSLQLKVDEYGSKYEIEDFSVNLSDLLMADEADSLSPEILASGFGFTLSQLKNIDESEYYRIMDERMDRIHETYPSDYRLMLREGKDLVFGKYRLRAYYDSDDIDLTYLESGRKPETDTEICLNNTFMKNQDLKLGDFITLGDREYTIVGSVLYVDYSLALIDNQMLFDMDNSGVALFTDSALDDIRGEEFFYISGKYQDKSVFRDEVIDKFNESQLDFVNSITLTENQIRSGAILEEIRGGQAMTLGLAIIISMLAVLTVAIITYKMLSAERKQIGLLKAMGYRNSEITMPYVVMITIISLPMLLAGYFAGVEAAGYLKGMYISIYMLPDVAIHSSISVLLTSIIVPFIFIFGLSYLIIRRMLERNALSLLKYSENAEATRLNRITNRLLKNARATTRFKYSYLTQSPGKMIVFIIGIFSASSLFVMSVMFYGFSERMVDDFYNSKAYQYEGIVDFSRELPELNPGEEKYLDGQVMIGNETITVKGVEPDNELYRIYRSDENITPLLEDGAIINKALAISMHLEKGDEITISFRDRELSTEVMEVSDNASDRTLYLSRSALGDLYGDEDLYSGIYSVNPIGDDYKMVYDKQDILDLSTSMNGFINLAMGMLLAISMLISVLILYILTTLTVEDNYYSISLLKVMGYTRKEVRRMILNSYLTYSIIFYLLAIPVTVMALNYMMAYFTEYYNMYMSFDMNMLKGIAGLVLIVAVYLLGSYQAGREINEIPLQEVLKEYQE